MKNLFLSLCAVMLVAFQSRAGEENTLLNIGDPLPKGDQEVLDVSGSKMSLAQVAGKNGLLVIFSCNTCPYVLAWEGRYPEIAQLCEDNGIGFILLNPNEAKRDGADSFDEMKAHAEETGYDFYYAVDENHTLADAMGASKTPDVFLFNADLKLAYQGAIDDNVKDAENVSAAYLKDAIRNMLAGKTIDPNQTKAIGCTIKRLAAK